ncbi:unnamed protein product [Gongylonema pulchrum]|uniref:Zgc:194224 n=1 Tax=Gongylonema pulchrum TaxID=637853 RepID=A0A183ECL6_9BILA|nr:unnamed protein product [Gongylonema pulchrum]
MEKMRPRPSEILAKPADKERMMKASGLKPHTHEKRPPKEPLNKQPSLNEIFRQQAQFFSEVRKKQSMKARGDVVSQHMKQQKAPSEESGKMASTSENRKGAAEGSRDQKHAKESEKKEKSESSSVVRKEKKLGSDGHETKPKVDLQYRQQQQQQKERKEKKEVVNLFFFFFISVRNLILLCQKKKLRDRGDYLFDDSF